LLVDGIPAFDELGEVAFRLCYLFFHRLGSFVGQVVHPAFFGSEAFRKIPQIVETRMKNPSKSR
jgi:hypothetical protein